MLSVFASVIVNSRQSGIGNGLTYRAKVEDPISIGSLVKVPLRRKVIEGIIIDVQIEKPKGDFDVKEISEILPDEPLLTKDQIEIARWMAHYYCCTVRQALSVWLPGGVWSRLLPESHLFVKGVKGTRLQGLKEDSNHQRAQGSKVLGKKQQLLIDYLDGKDWVKWDQIKDELDRIASRAKFS